MKSCLADLVREKLPLHFPATHELANVVSKPVSRHAGAHGLFPPPDDGGWCGFGTEPESGSSGACVNGGRLPPVM